METRNYTIRLGARGRMVLPSTVRKQFDLNEGDRLVMIVSPDGELRLRSAESVVKSVRGIYRDLAGNRSLADELIAERRQEAREE